MLLLLVFISFSGLYTVAAFVFLFGIFAHCSLYFERFSIHMIRCWTQCRQLYNPHFCWCKQLHRWFVSFLLYFVVVFLHKYVVPCARYNYALCACAYDYKIHGRNLRFKNKIKNRQKRQTCIALKTVILVPCLEPRRPSRLRNIFVSLPDHLRWITLLDGYGQ